MAALKTRNGPNLKAKTSDPEWKKASPSGKKITSKSVQDKNQLTSTDDDAETLKKAISRSIQKISALASSTT